MWYSLFSLKFNIFITTSINYLNKKSVCDLNLACNGKWQGPIQWCQCCRQERSHRFVRSLISVNDALQGYVNQVPQELKENRKCKEYKELPADVAVVLTEKKNCKNELRLLRIDYSSCRHSPKGNHQSLQRRNVWIRLLPLPNLQIWHCM